MKTIISIIILSYVIGAFIRNKRISAVYAVLGGAVAVSALAEMFTFESLKSTVGIVSEANTYNSADYAEKFDSVYDKYEYEYICRIITSEIRNSSDEECTIKFQRAVASNSLGYIITAMVNGGKADCFALEKAEENVCARTGIGRSCLKITYEN